MSDKKWINLHEEANIIHWLRLAAETLSDRKTHFICNDIDNDHFTVKEFIKLTRNSFGGDVIRQLEKEINHGSDTTH